MRQTIKRCHHCQVTYTCQISGANIPQNNSTTYCPECQQATIDALAKIPVKRQKVFVDTDEITPEQFNEWYNSSEEQQKDCQFVYDNDGNPVKMLWRVWPESVVLNQEIRKNGFPYLMFVDSTHTRIINGNGDFDGREYQYIYWVNGTKPATMKVAWEQDVVSGKMVDYWRNY